MFFLPPSELYFCQQISEVYLVSKQAMLLTWLMWMMVDILEMNGFVTAKFMKLGKVDIVFSKIQYTELYERQFR